MSFAFLLQAWRLAPFGRRSPARLAALLSVLALAACAPEYGPYEMVSDGPMTTVAPRKLPARVAIPLPNQTLLQPLNEPDCGAEQPDAQRVASAAPAQPDPNADLALRIKLDYERECYRKAEERVRQRLQKLQAATSETVKAVKQNEQSGR